MAQIQFKGKSLVWNHHLGVEYCELVPDESKSLSEKASLNDNLIIHGDNLKALKSLLPTYAGKVKCVYIDPPYNTGKEGWAYSDNVSSPMIKEWLGEVVNRDDLTRHDKWLCMMTPRLKLLRELLSEDGAIFISIDHNEQEHLKNLMDEIFGEGNYIGTFVWRKKSGGGQTDDYFVTEHEYVYVYQRSTFFKWKDEQIDDEDSKYTYEDSEGKYKKVKLAKWGSGSRRSDRPTMYFPLKSPDGKNIYPIAPDGGDGRWRVGKERVSILKQEDLIEWAQKNNKALAQQNS